MLNLGPIITQVISLHRAFNAFGSEAAHENEPRLAVPSVTVYIINTQID